MAQPRESVARHAVPAPGRSHGEPQPRAWQQRRILPRYSALARAARHDAAPPSADERPQHLTELVAHHKQIEVWASDHGIGIDPARQAQIFERFERAVSDRHYGGLGLGLHISRRIAEAHGGSIRVQSVPGAGATFIVELPRAGPPRTAGPSSLPG